MALVGAPPLERCASASSFASEPWFDDHGAVQRRAVAAVKSFVATIIGEDESSNRANLGAEAILLTLQAKKLRKRFGMKSTLEDLENLMMLCSMCGWRKNALKYARKLLELPSCHDDDECFCRTAGRIVTFTRQVFNESSAVQFFEERSRPRCPYQSAWQMPTPHKGYANWLEARSFWDPSRFGVARTMIERRADLLRELRPFARHHDAMRTLWPTSEVMTSTRARPSPCTRGASTLSFAPSFRRDLSPLPCLVMAMIHVLISDLCTRRLPAIPSSWKAAVGGSSRSIARTTAGTQRCAMSGCPLRAPSCSDLQTTTPTNLAARSSSLN